MYIGVHVNKTLNFDDLLTVHLSIILTTNLMYKFLFYNKFIIFLYMFRALLCSSSGGQILLYSISYRHTCRWPSGAQMRTGRPPACVTLPDAV